MPQKSWTSSGSEGLSPRSPGSPLLSPCSPGSLPRALRFLAAVCKLQVSGTHHSSPRIHPRASPTLSPQDPDPQHTHTGHPCQSPRGGRWQCACSQSLPSVHRPRGLQVPGASSTTSSSRLRRIPLGLHGRGRAGPPARLLRQPPAPAWTSTERWPCQQGASEGGPSREPHSTLSSVSRWGRLPRVRPERPSIGQGGTWRYRGGF